MLRKRGHLKDARLTEPQWRAEWESARLFLTADGEKDKAWGNETIRVHPDEGWLEIKLPTPLAHLANQPHGRYRLSCSVGFSYRGDEVAAQAATGAVRYDISHDPQRDRWYLDASWKTATAPAPSPPDQAAQDRPGPPASQETPVRVPPQSEPGAVTPPLRSLPRQGRVWRRRLGRQLAYPETAS
jgi:hypothetical protein